MKEMNLEQLIESVQETVEGIIKTTLRVSLDSADGSYKNQKALDVRSKVNLILWKKFNNPNDIKQIRDPKNYSAKVTYNACFGAICELFPNRCSLQRQLYHFLNTQQGFAVWEADDGEHLCGFAGWRNRKASDHSGRLAQLQNAPDSIDQSGLTIKDYRMMKSGDWRVLFDKIFNWVDSPIGLNKLVNIVAELLGVKDEIQQAKTRDLEENEEVELDRQSTRPVQENRLSDHELYERYWTEICQMRPNQRFVFLLNLREESLVEIDYFLFYGVATLVQIGRTLQISDEQFKRLWNELQLDDETRLLASSLENYDEKIALLWKYLPIKDKIIALALGKSQQNVITMRSRAIEWLQKRMIKYMR
jgi:hypothetical protein